MLASGRLGRPEVCIRDTFRPLRCYGSAGQSSCPVDRDHLTPPREGRFWCGPKMLAIWCCIMCSGSTAHPRCPDHPPEVPARPGQFNSARYGGCSYNAPEMLLKKWVAPSHCRQSPVARSQCGRGLCPCVAGRRPDLVGTCPAQRASNYGNRFHARHWSWPESAHQQP